MPVGGADAHLIGLIRKAVPYQGTVGVALSGGGDSVALLHLLLLAGFQVEAVTVDHRLRPDSAQEAGMVAADCARLGIRHEVRVWHHDTVLGNLMDEARRARMTLIAEWARARRIGIVALGHTRDDQAETLLMGLARAAGLDGLAGMRRDWWENDVRFLRPLLDAGRAELRDWLRESGTGWIDDPTNDNDRFTRVKARQVLTALAPLGISAESLAATAGHLAQAKAALDMQVVAAAARIIHEAAGALRFDQGAFAAEPVEIRRRLILAALLWLARAGYPPRADAVARLETALAEGGDATLWGCRVSGGWISREARAVAGEQGALGAIWDGRWTITGPKVSGAVIRPLGAAGLRACKSWRKTGLPRDVLAVTPAVWDGDTLVSAPLAGCANGWTALIDAPFHLFGQSH